MEKCHFESFQVFPCLAYVASVSVRFRSKEQGKRVKMTKVKEFGGGGEERKETLADKARILKTAHLASHAWVRALTFDGVISCQNWPIKCLAFRGVEMNFRGHVCENRIFFFCILVCLDGVNVEISMNPKDQCRLCTFVLSICLKGRTARVKFLSFRSKPPERWIWSV